jgi:type VI secretion system secreted protein Hcp
MASVDYFLKIDGIDGESTQKGHEKEIELMSFSWGESNAGSFAGNMGGGSGKVSMQDFHFTVPINKSSPKLFLACATGEHIKSAVLTCRKAGKTQQEIHRSVDLELPHRR